MLFCPICKAEYEEGVARCVDCDIALVHTLPPEEEDPAPVVVLRAKTIVEAQIAEATLQAAGIPAFVQEPDPLMMHMIHDIPNPLEVLVPAHHAGEASAVLNASPISEAELAALEESEEAARDRSTPDG